VLYSILIHGSEALVDAWTGRPEENELEAKLGPVICLMPTTAATTLRWGRELLVLDGPVAPTREQLLGICVLECETLEQAIDAARRLAFESAVLEIRPIAAFRQPTKATADA
jgi:hypothetical protein